MFLNVFLTKLTPVVTALCQLQHDCLKTLKIFLVVINIWQLYPTKVANNIARGFHEDCFLKLFVMLAVFVKRTL